MTAVLPTAKSGDQGAVAAVPVEGTDSKIESNSATAPTPMQQQQQQQQQQRKTDSRSTSRCVTPHLTSIATQRGADAPNIFSSETGGPNQHRSYCNSIAAPVDISLATPGLATVVEMGASISLDDQSAHEPKQNSNRPPEGASGVVLFLCRPLPHRAL